MKRIISVCALALFISASIIGCGGSPTTQATPPAGPPGSPKAGAPAGKDKPAEKKEEK